MVSVERGRAHASCSVVHHALSMSVVFHRRHWSSFIHHPRQASCTGICNYL